MSENKETSEQLLHQDITEEIIKAYYSVYNELGFGFLEKVYQTTCLWN